jgi:hypothetical protein
MENMIMQYLICMIEKCKLGYEKSIADIDYGPGYFFQ